MTPWHAGVATTTAGPAGLSRKGGQGWGCETLHSRTRLNCRTHPRTSSHSHSHTRAHHSSRECSAACQSALTSMGTFPALLLPQCALAGPTAPPATTGPSSTCHDAMLNTAMHSKQAACLQASDLYQLLISVGSGAVVLVGDIHLDQGEGAHACSAAQRCRAITATATKRTHTTTVTPTSLKRCSLSPLLHTPR